TTVKLKTYLFFVPETVGNPNLKGLRYGRSGSIIQPELLCGQLVKVIGQVRRFIIILQYALSVKLEVTDEILRVAVISCSLYGNAYLNGLPIGNIFRYRHHFYLKRKIILYFEFIVFATRYQRN